MYYVNWKGKNKNFTACKETKSPARRRRKYTARKDRNENTILQQDTLAQVDETTKKNIQFANVRQHQQRWKTLMKQLKRVSKIKIQSNTSKEGKTLMKQLKRISRLRIESNTRKEGTTLMNQLKRISRLKIQSNTSKEGKTLMKQLKEYPR